jgi:hypothetical protein
MLGSFKANQVLNTRFIYHFLVLSFYLIETTALSSLGRLLPYIFMEAIARKVDMWQLASEAARLLQGFYPLILTYPRYGAADGTNQGLSKFTAGGCGHAPFL